MKSKTPVYIVVSWVATCDDDIIPYSSFHMILDSAKRPTLKGVEDVLLTWNKKADPLSSNGTLLHDSQIGEPSGDRENISAVTSYTI